MNLRDFKLTGEPIEAINREENGNMTFKDISFRWVQGQRNGQPCVFVQYWLTDAAFCTIHQGWWDSYAFKFKFTSDDKPEAKLEKAINHAFIATCNPIQKQIGR